MCIFLSVKQVEITFGNCFEQDVVLFQLLLLQPLFDPSRHKMMHMTVVCVLLAKYKLVYCIQILFSVWMDAWSAVAVP